jgi:predicted RNase H-like nuclease (RuvC/YqgF family)
MVTEKILSEEAAGDEDQVTTLQRTNEALAREIEARTEHVARLEQALAGRESEIAALKLSLDEASSTLDEQGKALAKAVAAYKELVIKANPGLLAELITGDTIEAVDASLKQARALIEKVRQEMEAEAARTHIPAGSPPRAPLDFSGLSAREKIQYAIGGN